MDENNVFSSYAGSVCAINTQFTIEGHILSCNSDLKMIGIRQKLQKICVEISSRMRNGSFA